MDDDLAAQFLIDLANKIKEKKIAVSQIEETCHPVERRSTSGEYMLEEGEHHVYISYWRVKQ